MTSKLSDAKIAAQLRAMGLDIGPVNDWTRGVYRRKLERLLLEQSILSSPEKYPQQTKTRLKFTTTPDLAVITSTAAAEKEKEEEGMEDDLGLDDIPEGSLRLEEDDDDEEEEDEDFMDENLCGGCGADRNVIGGCVADRNGLAGVDARRPTLKDESDGGGGGGAQGKGSQQNFGDIPSPKGNMFALNATNTACSSTFVPKMTAPKKVTSTTRDKKALPDDGGSRKASNCVVPDGSFSSTLFPSKPSATLKNKNNNKRTDAAVMSHQLRQRTALPRHQDATNDVGSSERAALKPDDCVPSPRNPLSTYLDRCTPPPPSSSTFHPTDQHPSAGRVQQTKREETGMWIWIGLAVVAAVCFLAFLVLYNMEPGYASPI